MGDDERDLGIFRQVNRPIAFKPNDVLKQKAQEHNWLLVNEDTIIDKIKRLSFAKLENGKIHPTHPFF